MEALVAQRLDLKGYVRITSSEPTPEPEPETSPEAMPEATPETGPVKKGSSGQIRSSSEAI